MTSINWASGFRDSPQRRAERRREIQIELEDAEAKYYGEDTEATAEPLVLMSGDDIAREEREGRDSQMLIEGLLPARGFSPLIGDSGLGKSPLLMQLAACVATGTPFLGLPVRQGKVLINDHENQGRVDLTFRAVSRAIGKDYDRDVKPHLSFLPSREAADVFKVFDAGHKFALVIVDALRGFCGGTESDSKVIAPLITKMSSYDTCWVVCHHLRKEDRKASAIAGRLDHEGAAMASGSGRQSGDYQSGVDALGCD